MREEMQNILKVAFRELAMQEREERGLTQRQMAELLEMSERSYADIESGASACGTLTEILLLLAMSDPAAFLQNLKSKFEILSTFGGNSECLI